MIAMLDWFNTHKEDIWASMLTIVYAIEKLGVAVTNAGGYRTIWSKFQGPKQPVEAQVNKQQESK